MDATGENDRSRISDANKNKQKYYGSILPDADDFIRPATGLKTRSDDETPEELWTKRRIWFNIALLNVAVFFLYVGVTPVSLVQSSMNSAEGLGVASLAVKNAFMMVGAFFSAPIIQKFNCKLAIIVGVAMYVSYVPANFYPSWWTLIPFAIASGVGSCLKEVAMKVYCARLAHLYSEATKMDVDRFQSRVFVLLVVTTQVGVTVGNLVASTILRSADVKSDNRNCGINYCNEELTSGVVESADRSDSGAAVNVMLAFCTVTALVSVALLFFLDPLKRFGIVSYGHAQYKSPVKDLLLAMKDPKHILFVPMAMALYGGDSFWMADFNKAFISCSLGMSYVGYVWAWNGVTTAIGCVLIGWFNKQSVRSFPIVCSTLMQMLILTCLFYWTPSPVSSATNYWTLSGFTIIYMFGSSSRHFFVPSLVSVVFKDSLETAFSVYHFWAYASATLFFAWSNLICVDFKIYFLLIILVLSFIGYIFIEVILLCSTDYNRNDYQPLVD